MNGAVEQGPVRSGGPAGVRSWCTMVAQWALGRPAWYGLPAALPFLSLGDTIYRLSHPATAISGSAATVVSRTRRLLAREQALVDLGGFRRRIVNGHDRFDGAGERAEGLVTLPTRSGLSSWDLLALEGWLETSFPGAPSRVLPTP